MKNQVEHWRARFFDIERQQADLTSELEKEKALWQGRVEFMEKQKATLKQDNADALVQFKSTVEQLQKSNNEHKSKGEQNQAMLLSQIEAKFKKELKEQNEANQLSTVQLNNTIRRLEKENKALNERLEINNKSLMSEAGGLEKKLERTTDERDRLKEENESVKASRDQKIEELRRQFDREKEILKQKNMELQSKSKNIDTKQTDLILQHETNRAKWDQEKSYLISAKEDAISELKSIQKRYENSVKEIERLKESTKRNNWRMNNKDRVGGLATNNAMMYKVGEGMLGRLNLGGAGGGLNRQPDVSASQILPKGEMGYRSTLGVDKSMENFKVGFSQQFAAGGITQAKLETLNSSRPGATFGAGAVTQPKIDTISQQSHSTNTKEKNPLDSSQMRQSNILSTPSSQNEREEE